MGLLHFHSHSQSYCHVRTLYRFGRREHAGTPHTLLKGYRA